MRRTALVLTVLTGVVVACAPRTSSSPSEAPSAPPERSETAAPSAPPSGSPAPAEPLSGQLAYATGGEDPQLFLLDLATGESRQLTQLEPADAELIGRGALAPVLSCGFGVSWMSWSPDGSQLAFTYGGCDTVLYLLDLDGNLTRIAEGRAPAWSPDGAHIAFGPNIPYCPAPGECGAPPRAGAWNLQVVEPAAGTAPRAVSTDEATWYAGQPRWSPDGALIAFTARNPAPGDDRDGFAATWVGAADGGEPRVAARGSWPVDWLPDGRLVVAREGVGDLHAIDLASGDSVALGTSQGPAFVSPDGTRLLLTVSDPMTGATGTQVASIEGELLVEHAGYAGTWAPNSSAAVVIDSEDVGGLVVISRDGDRLGEYRVEEPTGVWAVDWRPGS